MLTTPDEKTFMISAETAGEGRIEIQILDTKGDIVFSKNMKALSSFQQKYNLKDFAQGDYSLIVTDESKIITQPFQVTETEIEVEAASKTTAFKPYFKYNEKVESLAVNWMKADNSTCEFSIEDENTNVLLEESIENDGTFHRSYDFSELPAGTYYMVIKDGNHTYNETIEIK